MALHELPGTSGLTAEEAAAPGPLHAVEREAGSSPAFAARKRSRARLKRLSARAEELGVTLLLENMNWEPDDAEVHYLAHNVEETLYYFSRLDSPNLRWAFTANHAHLVEEGVDGFLANMDIKRCDEVRLADCWRNGKEIHLRPGEGDFDFPDLFRKLDAAGFEGYYMNAFGSLEDMIEGREILARMVEPVN